jgi:hypothetical protein
MSTVGGRKAREDGKRETNAVLAREYERKMAAVRDDAKEQMESIWPGRTQRRASARSTSPLDEQGRLRWQTHPEQGMKEVERDERKQKDAVAKKDRTIG